VVSSFATAGDGAGVVGSSVTGSWAVEAPPVGSSGLRIIKRGVELIINEPLLIKNLPFLGFYYNVKKVNNININLTKSKTDN